jgi:hypothetical protein
MATLGSWSYSLDRIVHARAFRHARCYAPEPVLAALHDVVAARELVLLVDVDTLERSALARVDRVMLLALGSLACAGVHVMLVARDERERAMRFAHAITGSRLVDPIGAISHARADWPAASIVAISDAPELLRALGANDRGLALGRPELTSANIAAAGDASVRATLWWLVEERMRTSAA